MAKALIKSGHPSIFPGKKNGARIQGVLTPVGSIAFERARRRLAKLASREVENVSDGDTAEYLARGHDVVQKFLEQ